jgi:LemA protein
MKKKILLIGGTIVLLFILFIVSSYNSLVKKEEKVKQNWSEVQNTYQRRLDLIPNLVSVVKGVTEFEQNVLQKVAEARSHASSVYSEKDISPDVYKQQKQKQDSLAAAVNRLIILIEAYPELQATQSYLALQKQLAGTERRIAVARKDFNESVFNYNQSVKSFPVNIVAGLLGFTSKQGFTSDAGADQAVEIKFNK